jgi:hypothetical protein
MAGNLAAPLADYSTAVDRSAFVWIVDEEGNLILPPDQVKVRLTPSAGARRSIVR